MCRPAGCSWRWRRRPTTLTVTELPTGVVPLRIVKVSVPSLTVPAGLVIVALSVTSWSRGTEGRRGMLVAVVEAAALTVEVWLSSLDPPKSAVPL